MLCFGLCVCLISVNNLKSLSTNFDKVSRWISGWLSGRKTRQLFNFRCGCRQKLTGGAGCGCQLL